MPSTNIAKKTMMKPEFDLTIELLWDKAVLHDYTPAGEQYAEEIERNFWDPRQIMDNVPPKLRLGVRTCTRNKFALVPPHSLH